VPLRLAMQELVRLLADADMAALPAVLQLRSSHPQLAGPRLAALDDAVGRLDFESALRQCHDLMEEYCE
jgi:hypothetical protein